MQRTSFHSAHMYSPSLHGRPEFHLRVIEARGLYSEEIVANFGFRAELDPYVVVKLKGLSHLFHCDRKKSKVNWSDNNPIWNQDFVLHPTKSTGVIEIKVEDQGSFDPYTYLGKAELTVGHYLDKGLSDVWLPLIHKKGQPVGEIHLQIQYGEGTLPFPSPKIHLSNDAEAKIRKESLGSVPSPPQQRTV